MTRGPAGAALVALLALLTGPLAVGCRTPVADDAAKQIDPRTRQLVARQALQDGRALRIEGRLEAAERVLRRGLRVDAQNAQLERALGHTLAALGRPEDAEAARARADAMDPPPPPLPTDPTPVGKGTTVVALLQSTQDKRLDEPGRWPEMRVEAALREHLRRRLPDAIVQRTAPESVLDAERWLSERDAFRVLSLRVDRADCSTSVKDGRIAVAKLYFAVAARDGSAPHAADARVVTEDPVSGDDCIVLAVQRALEAVLETPAWQRAAAAKPTDDATDDAKDDAKDDDTSWHASLRPLFPGIGRHVERAIRRGRSLLGAGQLGEARLVFEAGMRIDPQDPKLRDYLDDTERSLTLARQIARQDPGSDPDTLDPRLSPGQRAAAQVALEREQERRDELLAALAVLDEDLRAPAASALSTLHPVEIRNPHAFGPSLARKRSGGRIVARAAYAPDGEVLARYYFAPESLDPLLREEDTDGDGSADRWIAYSAAARQEVFEDGRRRGRPDLHLVFAEGGTPLERIELDLSGDERPEQVFYYSDGLLRSEERDTDGDGVIDRFDRFDAAGFVGVREEDIDGDGAIDVRSEFRAGKLVRREVSAPIQLPES